MNARTITPAPVRKTIHVNASAEHAFDVFARHTSRWWPPTHSLLKVPLKEAIIEPFVDGRWFQRGIDGSECDNGRVLAWEPPHRLLLKWQLNPQWEFDPDLHTEVEVTFTAENDGRTRVELEHRLIERMGAGAEDTRTRIDAPNGWTAILELYRQSADA
jgi:uncharacterized protein YndB with AHSA1/START domain